MTFPEMRDDEEVTELVRDEPLLTPDEARAFLRAEVDRRAASLRAFAGSAPEAVAQLAEVDVDRVIHLVGTTRAALALIAAAIVELNVTAQGIADIVGWMEVRPVAMDPTQPHLGIDIAYIVAFRALTKAQRWLLHTLAIWSPPPATISREHALTVARNSGVLIGYAITEEDVARLLALDLAQPVGLPETPEGTDIVRSTATTTRLALHPYVRYILANGLGNASLPTDAPEEVAKLSATELVAVTLANWAVRFAEIIAGPALATSEPELADEADDDEDDDGPGLTPDPALDALTDAEAWGALEPEAPHIAVAANIARELGSPEHIYRLNQLLVPVLRRVSHPIAHALLRDLLEAGLIVARATFATNETLLLATQLADVALIDNDLPRAQTFAGEALDAAIAKKDMRAIGFATRRVAAIAIRQKDAETALETARQAVQLARANGSEPELVESLQLLDLATRLQG